MKVIVSAKNSLNVTTYSNVASITFSTGNYVIAVTGGSTYSYAAANYFVMIAGVE